MIFTDLLVTGLLALSHGLEPDHISGARMMKTRRKVAIFAAFHSLGFLLITIPIAIALSLASYVRPSLEAASYIVGIAFGMILLMSVILGKELEIEPKGAGIVQGALVVTPSKILAIIFAMDTGSVLYGVFIVAWFSAITWISIFLMGWINVYIPKSADRYVNLAVSILTIAYFTFLLVDPLTV